jgi:biopolymer transport protein ExbD
MKLRSFRSQREPRLEIIPLIDIMIFLLAAFMMVSLQMQKVAAIDAQMAERAASPDESHVLTLTVDRFAQIATDEGAISYANLKQLLAAKASADPTFAVCLRGAGGATHGSVMYALDLVKQAGVKRVALAVWSAEENASQKP